ncbi:hypothetical protein [Corynebacterium sp.]|uniref:hypothetical protein n=1 Tax=Corynebacterium sp. TaxID=1720 RepID=UPI0028A68718|nr:hypothetical protein [Corynebacterium sp.]
MSGWLQRARCFATTDGMGLLILGAASIGRGISYAPGIIPESTRSSHVAETWLPMTAWSAVWVAVGVLCVIASGYWRSKGAALAVGASVGIHFVWGASFLWGTLSGEMGRGYVSALSYLAICALAMWAFTRGRREDGEVRSD